MVQGARAGSLAVGSRPAGQPFLEFSYYLFAALCRQRYDSSAKQVKK